MASSVDQLTAAIKEIVTCKLKNGRIVLVVRLNETYLRMILFMESIGESAPSRSRKRRKQRLPPSVPKRLVIQVVKPDNSRIKVTGNLEMSQPLDAPASMSLNVWDAREVPVGSRLELTIVASE